MPNLTQTRSWQALAAHRGKIADARIAKMFAADPRRFDRYCLKVGDLLLDYSKNLIDAQTMQLLMALVRERGVGDLMQAMFNAETVNSTENRAVLHTALRDTPTLMLNGRDVMVPIQATLQRMRDFSDDVRGGRIAGHEGALFTDVLHIGIGGSHLGPALAVRALAPYASPALRVHFVSNVDGAALQRTLAPLDPAATLVIVVSKTFTTIETMTNARSVRDWLAGSLGADAAGRQLVAVTANTALAAEFGIAEERVFPFWDWVGGRYSLWSAVGLPVALAVGIDRFEEMLHGAHEMDQHFRNSPFEQSMPVILAVLGIWYNDFCGAASHAVIPYDDSLALLPAYLQQLDMESSGKSVTRDGKTVNYDTGPVIWGAPGTDAQHSFFQLLHQGTRIIPADFIAACQPHDSIGRHHDILMANFFAQTAALMNGATALGAPHEAYPGNRPTNSLLLKKLTPHTLGLLLALYEHKVFVQTAIWGINAFDQPGVELGKRAATGILAELEAGATVTGHDASTNGLINFYQTSRQEAAG